MDFQIAPREFITAQYRRKPVSVAVADITHFTADSKYVVAHHPGGELLLDDTLKSLQAEFGATFLRIHRRCLVAKSLITGYHKARKAEIYDGGFITLAGVSDQLRVSRRGAELVQQALTALPELIASKCPPTIHSTHHVTVESHP